MIEIGQKAPDFSLPKNGGGTVSLNEFKGHRVIIYFYPKDSTTGCTKQAIDFTDLAKDFKDKDTVIIGISPDSVASHDKFTSKYNLNVLLGADEDKQILESYGVWKEKKMYGRTYMGVERSTFLVDRDGTIKALWRKVKAAGHAQMLLDELDKL